MYVLGVDGGLTEKSGMGLALFDPETLAWCATTTITPKKLGVPARSSWDTRVDSAIRWLDGWLAATIDYPNLQVIAYETAWIGANPQVAIKVATLCGAVRALGVFRNVPTIGISPAEGKIALTKDPRASKDGMIKMARLLLGEEHIHTSHEADAFGIGLAGFAQHTRAVRVNLARCDEDRATARLPGPHTMMQEDSFDSRRRL